MKLADLHFPGKDTKSESFTALMRTKTKYISANQSKDPDTILAAVLRSLTSRNVEVTAEDIGSPE